MALPVLTLRVRIFLFFALLMLAPPTIIGAAIWFSYQADNPDTTRLLATYAGVAAVMLSLLTAIIWQLFDRHVAAALQSLARQMQTALHADTPRLPDTESLRYLGPVSEAANQIASALHVSRVTNESAHLNDTAALEARQMAAILRDLDTGVLIMNLDHRVLLYNQRALCITSTPARPGLARPVRELFKGDALKHAAQRLIACNEPDSVAIPLILSPLQANRLLQGTVGLVRDNKNSPIGYVLVFDDVTERLSLANKKEQLAHFALGGARTAVEGLISSTRAGVTEQDLLAQLEQLQSHLNDVNHRYEDLVDTEWPMAEYLSADLLDSAVAALTQQADQHEVQPITVTVQGEAVWLLGNTYLLSALLTTLLCRITTLASPAEMKLETQLYSDTVRLQVSWSGEKLHLTELDAVLDSALIDVPIGISGRQVLTYHGTGVQILGEGDTQSMHLTLGASSRSIAPGSTRDEPVEQGASGTTQLSPLQKGSSSRPEFYDFDLFNREFNADMQDRSLSKIDYVVFDTETTGLHPSGGDEIISIAAVRIVNGRVLRGEYFDELVNPARPVPARSTVFHGITDDMLQGKPLISEVLPDFARFVGDSVLVAHNAAFDMKFIALKSEDCGICLDNPVLDTVLLSAWLHDHTHKHTLDDLAMRFGLTIDGRHSALGDSLATAEVFIRLIKQLHDREIRILKQALAVSNKMTHIKRMQQAY